MALYAKNRGLREMYVKDSDLNKELFSEISYAPASDDTPKSFVDAVEEAAIVGGGVGGSFRAQQMADRKAADLERRSGSTPKPNTNLTNTRPNTGLTTTTPNTGVTTTAPNTGLTTTSPNTGLTAPNSAPNTSLVQDPQMRNVTPIRGPGIGAVASGGLVANPLALGTLAFLGSTGTANQGSETQSFLNDLQANWRAIQEKQKADAQMPADVGNQRSPLDRQMTAPVEPKYTSQSEEGPQRSPVERQASAASQEEVLPPLKALMMPEEPTTDSTALSLFEKTHGGPFDPKSSMDKKKMAAIINLMGQEGSDKLTPNQFALKIYRTTKK